MRVNMPLKKICFLAVFLWCQISIAADYFIKQSLHTNANLPLLRSRVARELPSASLNVLNLPPGFSGRWAVLSDADSNAENMLQMLLETGEIEFFEAVGFFKLKTADPDSVAKLQWYLSTLHAEEAWTISTGNPDIIVAIIDTGIDYGHPDLQTAIWINGPEDLNGNGRLDEADLNGLDDDGNGFTDDVMGWDFTDAPRFADGGDYQFPDNDPMDEFGDGHGTPIAGIIAAAHGSEGGMLGLAPDIRVMNLRAGTAGGYLEEDDVARAVLYAVQNGARIINMSFGDVVLSQFLAEILNYAAGQGVLLIASSGNSGDDTDHFPSGLEPVMSVGAVNETGLIAGFSSYGVSLDLVAPGTNIQSTAIAGKYRSFNGTSFSAPMVSAAAALLFSSEPELTAREVRSRLNTTGTDLYFPGWDEYTGHGLLNPGRALQYDGDGELIMHQPQPGQAYPAGNIPVVVTLRHPDLRKAELSMEVNGGNPQLICEFEKTFSEQDTLAWLDLSAADSGSVILELKMTLLNGRWQQIRTRFSIDKTAPEIIVHPEIYLWDGDQPAVLLQCESDDQVDAVLSEQVAGAEEWREHFLSYRSAQQRLLLSGREYQNAHAYYFELSNAAGLKNRSAPGQFDFPPAMSRTALTEQTLPVPAGYLLNSFTDFDNDGLAEIVQSEYDQNFSYGPLAVYEEQAGSFVKTGLSAEMLIPRAAGDSDADNRSELLCGYGNRSYLYEMRPGRSLPDSLIWSDTQNFWAAALTDLDGDAQGEIIGYRSTSSGGEQYIALERDGSAFTEWSSGFANNSAGQNYLGVPALKIFPAQAGPLILFGDTDGDLIINRFSGNHFEQIGLHRHHFGNTARFFDGLQMSDGNLLIVQAAYSLDNVNYEHEFDARYWSVETVVFDVQSQNFSAPDTLNIYGYQSVRDFDSGLKLIHRDGQDFLALSLFPDFYLLERENEHWKPVWYNSNARSNTILSAENGQPAGTDILYQTGEHLMALSFGQPGVLAAPSPVAVQQQTPGEVLVSWPAVDRADFYRVEVKTPGQEWTEAGLTDANVFTDSIFADTLLYRVQAGRDAARSSFAGADTFIAVHSLNLTAFRVLNSTQLMLGLDQAVQISNNSAFDVHVRSGVERIPANVVLFSGRDGEIFLSLTRPLPADIPLILYLNDLHLGNGLPVSSILPALEFTYSPPPEVPYLKTYSISDRRHIALQFSCEINTADLLDKSKYWLDRLGEVEKVEVGGDDGTLAMISLPAAAAAGAWGLPEYLNIAGLHSAAGVPMADTVRINLFNETRSLSGIITYPQPVRPGQTGLTFGGLPERTRIDIFTLNGQHVRSLESPVYFGGLEWDLKDSRGRPVVTGIYLFRAENGSQEKTGKIAIVR